MRYGRIMLIAATLLGAPSVALGQTPDAEIMPHEAHMLAAGGALILIDIRRPDEWLETGVPEHAHLLRGDGPLFAAKLEAITEGRRDAPIAIICTMGVRTKALQRQLTDAGYTHVASVRGGISGGASDKGWTGYRLPLIDAP